MKLKPKQYHFLRQLIPFVSLWFLFGFVYVIIEYGILGESARYPSTGNFYNYRANMRYFIPASVLMGSIQGAIELLWLKKILRNKSLWKKIILKTSFYVLLITTFLIALNFSVNLIQTEPTDFNFASEELNKFVNAFAFWSIVIYVGFAIIITLFVSEVNDYLGNTIFSNFLLGKYNEPLKEERIFMFLDMKSSTMIAEKMGHERYFKFINDYYADMTEAILQTEGEIYQYVGDEIVITWPKAKGVLSNNCIQCFFKIQEKLNNHKDYYQQEYGYLPSFKAGLHVGEVTTGEIGVLKKEIIFTGDVLNTTARIQEKCNSFNVKILISKTLKDSLTPNASYQILLVDKLQLRGKKKYIEVFTLKRNMV